MNADTEDHAPPRMSANAPTLSQTTSALDSTLGTSQIPMLSPVYGLSDISRDSFSGGLDFASQLFGSKEAEDFSMFQLQPDLYSGDLFGAGLDQYYNSFLPRGDGMSD